ncbi:coiled coil domain-containing protein [Microbulbifer flavimaris]|uniref:Coiled coil domain-containing protein n=1 Tax=Microbulbifer flavimaris TaxID=1781068 RepID=A0ABX4HWI6_9GAMM|nr:MULTISPECIES: coiled coil domain-containing protein [Microbulbifer]KUJ81561.1 hypothetical protein AVO43_13475 [Microbulbifer sp. ZGT114]PCO04464.1 coiled coil domain-containing protein [Microbulbifer flavimaris]
MSRESDRSAYEQKARAKLKEWNAEIDKLSARAEQASADTKMKYRDEIDKLQSKRESMKRKLEQLHGKSGDAWDEFRDGLEDAWTDMKRSIERARDRLR